MDSQLDLADVAKKVCREENLHFEGLVGGGSFKQVFRVNESGKLPLALKIVKGNSPRTDREIQAIQRCSHANIARLFKSGKQPCGADSFDYTIEEYLSGGTLTQKLENGPLNNQDTLSLGCALISAVEHIALQGLVHRDIKPDNIMFREDKVTPVLVDFGLVRDLAATSLTRSWLLRGPGTPYFASPEQLNNQKRMIDWRSDQFALGIVLAFSRFGMHPYQYSIEPLYDSAAVERVANREARNPGMLSRFNNAGLHCLKKMTEPWPVQRYCRLDEFALQWAAQGDAK